MAAAVIPFHQFCAQILHLELTPGQSVLAKVAFGDLQPKDLEGEERELAKVLFGGKDWVSPKAKRYVVMRLGRGSGKTTLCSAYSVYCAVCQPVKVGPGDTPYVITVAPDLETAKLAIGMCREMIRSEPSLERLVIGDEKQIITIRRPGGLRVRIQAFAASRGGSSVRGRTILAFLLDEAEFFTSGENYQVNDTEIFRALKPRLVRNGKGMLISTPWPVETLMGKMFDANWEKCETALAIKAPTLLIRGDDPDVIENVAEERAADPDNARREYDCELDGFLGEYWFDPALMAAAIVSGDTVWPQAYNAIRPTAVAADLGFVNDSSTLVAADYDGSHYGMLYAEEHRPKPGKPLKPSEVFTAFSKATKMYGCSYIVADGHYREAFKEHLDKHQIALVSSPEGLIGKQEMFSRVRSLLQEGRLKLPDCDMARKLVAQSKLVTAKASPGGNLTIKIPRKAGQGHGDLVSAWVAAVHKLTYSAVKNPKVHLEYDSPEWHQEVARKLREYYDKQNERALKASESDVRQRIARRGGRMADGVTFARR